MGLRAILPPDLTFVRPPLVGVPRVEWVWRASLFGEATQAVGLAFYAQLINGGATRVVGLAVRVQLTNEGAIRVVGLAVVVVVVRHTGGLSGRMGLDYSVKKFSCFDLVVIDIC